MNLIDNPMHGITANYSEVDRFTKQIGPVQIEVLLEKVVPVEAEDEWYHKVRVKYSHGHSRGSLTGMRIDPENPKLKNLYQMICDEINSIEGRNGEDLYLLPHYISQTYNKMVMHERTNKIHGEGEFIYGEATEINGVKVSTKRLYRDGEYCVEVTYKRPENNFPILVASWVEDTNQGNYYNMYEEVVSTIRNFKPKHGDFQEVLFFLHYMEEVIESNKQQAYEDYVDKKANDAVQETVKMRILLKGVHEIRDITNNLWDSEETLYANRLYVAIRDLMVEGNFLRQHINDQLLDVVQTNGISLSEEQLDKAIDAVEFWVNEGLAESIQTAVEDAAEIKRRTSYSNLVTRAAESFRISRDTLEMTVNFALEQEYGSGETGYEIIKAFEKTEEQFVQDVENSI